MLRVIVLGFVLAVAKIASAAPFSVEVTGPAWQADALAVALRHDLAKDARDDLTVRVSFAGTALTYVVTRTGLPPIRGASALGALDRRELANAIIDAMHRLGSTRRAAEGPAPPFALLALLLGGLAWGAFAAACIPRAFPPLIGLHRVEHHELPAAIGAWIAVAIQRALFVSLALAPLVAAVWFAGLALELSALVTWGVVLPIAGLVVRFVWQLTVRLLAKRLDAELVDGAPTTANPWHAEVRGYLGGYLVRANLDVDETLVESMRFLPGREDDAIYVYAGRVVIGRAILEHALAPYGRPHDFAMPRVSTLHWTHWNSGLVMATEADQKLATREDRDPSKHATVDEGVHERVAIGEPPTFTGFIEPVMLDGRTQYRPGDDPLWLDWDPGEEFDGTDAGDKDFLFGVLVLAMGAIQRHEDRGGTLALWWKRRFGRMSVARFFAAITGPVRRFAAARSAALADVHAMLAGARHHVTQYHAWRLWRRDALITSRAYVPELEATSRAIVATLERDSDSGDGHEAAALRDRIAHLRAFVEPEGTRKRTRKRRLVVSFAMLAGLALMAALAVQAVLYHSTYEQRLDQQISQQRRQHDG
jgi:hypothetical protein